GMWRLPIVERGAERLVLDEDTGAPGREFVHVGQDDVERLWANGDVDRTVARAEFHPVAADGQHRYRQEFAQQGNRAPADDRDTAFQDTRKPVEQARQTGADRNAIGRGSEFHERAVEIEKQRRAGQQIERRRGGRVVRRFGHARPLARHAEEWNPCRLKGLGPATIEKGRDPCGPRPFACSSIGGDQPSAGSSPSTAGASSAGGSSPGSALGSNASVKPSVSLRSSSAIWPRTSMPCFCSSASSSERATFALTLTR